MSDLPTEIAELSAGPVEYRLDRHGDGVVVIFHGGHMRAGIALGEDVYADAGHTVLAPSRPGYGRTPVSTGTTPAGFADVTAELCQRLGIDRVTAVVGISAGGRTAVTMAARHPRLVERVVLESSVSFASWPDRRTRLGAKVGFHPAREKATWAAVRALFRLAPALGLRSLMGSLSVTPVTEVLAALSPADRAAAIALFTRMRSGGGFLNDLGECTDVAAEVTQPALIIASRGDGAVPFAHSETLAAAIPNARLVESRADGHLLWFSPDHDAIAQEIRRFLTAAA